MFNLLNFLVNDTIDSVNLLSHNDDFPFALIQLFYNPWTLFHLEL